jgi:tetratricopeptide (TPR) repeat protein
LYEGRPVSRLDVNGTPNQEAIARGDAAMYAQQDDLALFEYIRALSLPSEQFRDETLYKKVLNIHPQSSKLLLNIGYSYYMSGDILEAKDATLAALALDPCNSRAQNNLGLIYLSQGENTASDECVYAADGELSGVKPCRLLSDDSGPPRPGHSLFSASH